MIDPAAVGVTAGPTTRSWTSDEALLYALGVGAGTSELAFTTENTHECPQQV
ncbi:MAG: dehydrogenase, partial [Actinomycetia bacterium]|nr:dehydrogenase [Actinomycetes bacterium]